MNLLYVRFGELPPNGCSRNHLTGEEEVGVSVYEAIERDGRVQIIVPKMAYGVHVSLSGFVGVPAYVVDGKVVGYGSDGEPLLANCCVVRCIRIEGKREENMAWLQVENAEPCDETYVWGYTGGIELLYCRKWNGVCFYRPGDYFQHLGKAQKVLIELWHPLEWPEFPS